MNGPSLTATLSARLSYVLNALALFALLLSREIKSTFLYTTMALVITALALRQRKRSKSENQSGRIFIVSSLVSAIALAFYLVIKLKWHPVDAAANVAMVVAALVLFLKPGRRERFTRLAYDFLVIVLAAALSPELETAVVLFLFVLISSLQLTLLFLDSQKSSASISWPILNRVLWFNGIAAVLTFTISLGLFPLLPKLKPKWSMGLDLFPNVNPGYTEDVDLRTFGKWSGAGDEPVLRISVLDMVAPRRDANLSQDRILTGALAGALARPYLRGRVLDHFDGTKWLPSKDSHGLSQSDIAPRSRAYVTLEISREPLASHTVLVPYGTEKVSFYGKANDSSELIHGQAKIRSTGDLVALGTQNRRQKYQVRVSLQAQRQGGYFSAIDDSKDDSNTGLAITKLSNKEIIDRSRMLPASWQRSNDTQDQRIQKLESEIFNGSLSSQDKIYAVAEYFAQKGGYIAELSQNNPILEASATPIATQNPGRAQLESFIFNHKSGHCGLFASATAWLLRRQNIPARVISGFAVTQRIEPATTNITIRNRDAHAWVEAWIDGKGWVPIDSTPPLRRSLHGLGYLEEALEALSDSWYFTKDQMQRYWFDKVLKLGSSDESSGQTKNQVNSSASGWSSNDLSKNLKSLSLDHPGLFVLIFLGALGLFYWMVKSRAHSRTDLYEGHVPKELMRLRKQRNRIIDRIEKRLRPAKRAEEAMVVTLDRINQLDERMRFGNSKAQHDTWQSHIQNYKNLLKELEHMPVGLGQHRPSTAEDPCDKSTANEKKAP
jgi:transglutaminase-like putative cysteine protease